MTAIPLTNTGNAVGGQAPAQGHIGITSYIVILLQLGLLTLLLRQFQIESAAFLRLALFAFGGFAIHALLPMRYRQPFFLGLSLVGIVLVFDMANGLSIIGLGLVLIGICHLPLSFRLRGVLLLLVGALLAALRAKWLQAPVSDAIWPILGSMFMFRLIVYFYDLRHDTAPVSPVRTLAYFFMLPNACFPLFPVVDYKAFQRNYYDDDAYRTYQVGVDWMVRGVIHLILYRFVYYQVTLAPSEVTGPAQLFQFLVANFALYLRVSGLFHLIVGMLYLFGFRLPWSQIVYRYAEKTGPGGRSRVLGPGAAPLTPPLAALVNGALRPPDPSVADQVRRAADLVASALPAGWLERITIGSGEGVPREARLGVEAGPAELVAAAVRGFVRAAAAVDPPLHPSGLVVAGERRLDPAEALAWACGNAAALPWRADRSRAAHDLALDIDDICAVAEPTASGTALLDVLRAVAGDQPARRRALLVNVDASDFVYSFQFGRSVERRCAERGWRVDRLVIETGIDRDLAAELGHAIPSPIADGSEATVSSEADPAAIAAIRRFAARQYEAVIANVRPKLFYDLVESGVLATRSLLWDRHLHDGLVEERGRRGIAAARLSALPIRVWSLLGQADTTLPLRLVETGLERGAGHAWPMDLEFFRSDVHPAPSRIFAGGDSARDWDLFVRAVRDLPLEVH